MIVHVVGARPNFVKAAPVMRALRSREVDQLLIHTGQHYDSDLYDKIFKDVGLTDPDFDLGVGSGSHSEQTAQVMLGLEPLIKEIAPRWVVVYGDVNSTLAAALVSAKLRQPLAHVEAGLRSFDRSMPEEINRLLTDQLGDLLFAPSADACENLEKEGIPAERIRLVGNVMIDTLIEVLPLAEKEETADLPDKFVLVTLHRPSNVDDADVLSRIVAELGEISSDVPILFPVHPRTQRILNQIQIPDGVRLLPPLGYLRFLALQQRASVVVTDSGGIQEETTYLGIPCLTLRAQTERPITVTLGTNEVVADVSLLVDRVAKVLSEGGKQGQIPELWDGKSGERIAEILA